MDKKKKQDKGIWTRYLSIICLALVAVVAMNSIIDAKYVTSKRNDPAAVAEAFYFESDLLKSGSTPSYTLPAGTTTISFVLKNYTDALRYADSKVNYEVILSKDDSNVYHKSGGIDTGKANDEKVEFTGLKPGTYIATATATSPYSATLTARFIIPQKESPVEYEVLDSAGSPIAQLTVRTNNYRGNVTISWPNGVKPDNTDPLLRYATGNSATIKFENDAEYTFVFFKSSHNENYSENPNFKATAN